MKRRIKHLSIRDGSLIPLGNNFAYVLGDHPNKVDDVDIGPNNKNGLSVNHGELMQFGGNSVRVFSAEPILNGVSPSKLVQAGMNPNAVFAAQEKYKDIHHLKDDGSHAKLGKWLKNLFNKKSVEIDDTPEFYGGNIKPAIATATLPAKFHGSQQAAARYAEGYRFGKQIAQQRDAIAPELMPLIMGPLSPSAILGAAGGKGLDTIIQQFSNNKRSGWSDAATFFLDNDPKAKHIGEIVADFINPGYLLGSIAAPIGNFKLISSNWKPSVKSKYEVVPSSVKNTLNIDTPYNKFLRDRIAKQVINNSTRQKQIYNKALHYLGQAFDDVPENIQKDILSNTNILDNFITRVRWGEGKDMISPLKYEANKIAFRNKQNIIYQKKLNYRYKNVPTLFKNVLDNLSPLYESIVKKYGKHVANKARYQLATDMTKGGYTPFNILNLSLSSLFERYADNVANPSFLSRYMRGPINKPIVKKDSLPNLRKFVDKYAITKQIDPADNISNPQLQQIARLSPKYAPSIYAAQQLGDTPEQIINDLLNRKWTFIRGINDKTGTLTIEDAKIAMSKIAENAGGGRADTEIFPSLLSTEDVTYFSNSPATAISYTYPTQPGKGYIGIYGRKEPFIEGNNLVDKWIKNQLPTDNILEAPSTVSYIKPQLELPDDKLQSIKIGFERGKTRGKIQKVNEANNNLYYLLKGDYPDSYHAQYRHFLVKGNKGEEIPYLTIKDIREVPKISSGTTTQEFDNLLKEFDVDAVDLNRGHSNKSSMYFSLGKKLGGETEVNSIYGTLPLKGNPLYDITGETKYADYINEPEFDFSGIKTTNKRPYNAANVKTAYDYFKAQGANDYQISALLANAIEESGVEPYALDKTNTYYGISQWDSSRYSAGRKSKKDKNYSAEVELKDLNDQLMYYYNSVMNGNTKVDWNHGGKGSGYNTAADARQSFRDAATVDDAVKALVLGYVRPTGGIDSYKNRAKVAEQIYKIISKQ